MVGEVEYFLRLFKGDLLSMGLYAYLCSVHSDSRAPISLRTLSRETGIGRAKLAAMFENLKERGLISYHLASYGTTWTNLEPRGGLIFAHLLKNRAIEVPFNPAVSREILEPTNMSYKSGSDLTSFSEKVESASNTDNQSSSLSVSSLLIAPTQPTTSCLALILSIPSSDFNAKTDTQSEQSISESCKETPAADGSAPRKRRKYTRRKKPETAPSPTPEDLFSLWKTHCGSLIKPRELIKSWHQKCLVRLKENPDLEYWETLIKKLANSEFACSGRWATFEWIIKNDSNHVKAYNGNYDNINSNTRNKHDNIFADIEKDEDIFNFS